MALLRTARLFMHYLPPLELDDEPGTRAIVPLFVCPAGSRAILRSAQFFSEAGGGAASLNVFSAEVPLGVVLFENQFIQVLEAPRWVQWNGHCVLNAGDRLEYSGTNAMTMIGSGAIMPIE